MRFWCESGQNRYQMIDVVQIAETVFSPEQQLLRGFLVLDEMADRALVAVILDGATHDGNERFRPERFEQVVVGSRLHAFADFFGRSGRSLHDDLNAAKTWVGAQAMQETDAVQIGHSAVDNHQRIVVVGRFELFPGSATVGLQIENERFVGQ